MKNAPNIKGSDTQITAPAVASTTRRARLNTQKSERMLVNGRHINFTLTSIPAPEIEEKTRIWKGNERIQSLLTDSALSDIIPSIRKGGLENPAKGRINDQGMIEIADGSRRRKACVISEQDYFIWVGELTDNDMDHLTKTGNTYRETSAYERGMRYKALIDAGEYETLEELASAEKIDRKTMRRCLRTATIPRCIIDLYPTVNDISARAGETLSKIINDKLIEIVENGKVIISEKEPQAVTRWLTDKANEINKPENPEKIWNDESLSINRSKGKRMTITLAPDIPEQKRDRIEKYIRKELLIEGDSNG